VNGLHHLLVAEAWPVSLNPGRFRSDAARMPVHRYSLAFSCQGRTAPG